MIFKRQSQQSNIHVKKNFSFFSFLFKLNYFETRFQSKTCFFFQETVLFRISAARNVINTNPSFKTLVANEVYIKVKFITLWLQDHFPVSSLLSLHSFARKSNTFWINLAFKIIFLLFKSILLRINFKFGKMNYFNFYSRSILNYLVEIYIILYLRL